MAENRIFSDVHLEAEQVTETHRTLNPDHTVTQEELPGLVNVYLVIDGGRILLDQIKAPVVLEAIANQGKEQSADENGTTEQTQAQGSPLDMTQGTPTEQSAAQTEQPQG